MDTHTQRLLFVVFFFPSIPVLPYSSYTHNTQHMCGVAVAQKKGRGERKRENNAQRVTAHRWGRWYHASLLARVKACREISLRMTVLSVLVELLLRSGAHESLTAHLADDALGLLVHLQLAVRGGLGGITLHVALTLLLGTVSVSRRHLLVFNKQQQQKKKKKSIKNKTKKRSEIETLRTD